MSLLETLLWDERQKIVPAFGVTLSCPLSFFNSHLHHLKEGANTGPGWCIKLIIHHPFSLHKATIDADLAVIAFSVQRAGKHLCLPHTSVLEGPGAAHTFLGALRLLTESASP